MANGHVPTPLLSLLLAIAAFSFPRRAVVSASASAAVSAFAASATFAAPASANAAAALQRLCGPCCLPRSPLVSQVLPRTVCLVQPKRVRVLLFLRVLRVLRVLLLLLLLQLLLWLHAPLTTPWCRHGADWLATIQWPPLAAVLVLYLLSAAPEPRCPCQPSPPLLQAFQRVPRLSAHPVQALASRRLLSIPKYPLRVLVAGLVAAADHC